MSAEVQESGGKRGKSKQKKMTVRVDFTPMVDMNMLLITFFMLCTTLSKPQTMEISMPSNDKDITENQKKMCIRDSLHAPACDIIMCIPLVVSAHNFPIHKKYVLQHRYASAL